MITKADASAQEERIDFMKIALIILAVMVIAPLHMRLSCPRRFERWYLGCVIPVLFALSTLAVFRLRSLPLSFGTLRLPLIAMVILLLLWGKGFSINRKNKRARMHSGEF